MAGTIFRLTWLALCAAALQNCSYVTHVLPDVSSTEEQTQTVAETLRSLGLNEVLRWIAESQLDHILNNSLTLFAPTDGAVAAAAQSNPSGQRSVFSDPAKRRQLLLYHVINGSVTLQMKTSPPREYEEQLIPSLLAGKSLRITYHMKQSKQVVLADGKVVERMNIRCRGGVVIQVVGGVLYPPDGNLLYHLIQNEQRFSSFRQAVMTAELASILQGRSSFTVFVPIDASFKQLSYKEWQKMKKNRLRDMVKYHLVPGTFYSTSFYDGLVLPPFSNSSKGLQIGISQGETYVNEARLVSVDLKTTNGVIHVIDKLLTPPTDTIAMYVSKKLQMAAMLHVIHSAEMFDKLNSEGAFSLLIPSAEAFSKLSPDELDRITSDESQVVRLLKNHVISGVRYSSSFVDRQTLRNTLGQELTIYRRQGELYLENARFLDTDFEATNGVMHVIDRILFPATLDLYSYLRQNPQLKTLTNFISRSRIDESLPDVVTVFAPTSAAFGKLLDGDYDQLIRNKTRFSNLVLSHVVPGIHHSVSFGSELIVQPLSGKPVRLTRTAEGNVTANGVLLVEMDVRLTNAIVHHINDLLSSSSSSPSSSSVLSCILLSCLFSAWP